MATEIRMPQFGVSMETGTVAQWLKAEGDTVKAGDVLASIETEKLTNDVVSEVDGVLLKIVAQEGEDIPVQGLMAYIGQPGEALPDGSRCRRYGSCHCGACACRRRSDVRRSCQGIPAGPQDRCQAGR